MKKGFIFIYLFFLPKLVVLPGYKITPILQTVKPQSLHTETWVASGLAP